MTAPAKRRATFSGLTEKGARSLYRGLRAADKAGFPGVRFTGAWIGRRLVIDGGAPVREMPAHPANPMALTLAVSSTLEPGGLLKAFRSFGATVERIWRDSEKGAFDSVVSADDGARHQVHRYHHVALCGHKPRRWVGDDEVAGFADEVFMCSKCISAAATKPAHRARWHPSAAGAPSTGMTP